MPTRRSIKNVLAGFIGTYTSRYSDYRGYWLHGQLTFESSRHEFNLLSSPPNDDTPPAAAWRLAVRRFKEQLAKAGLIVDVIREATLEIHMAPECVRDWQGNYMSDGHMVQFQVSAVMDNGRKYVAWRSVFVAPHDPNKEQRRGLNAWGT